MKLRERSLFDVGGGAVIALCGLLVALQSLAYPLGQVTRMGPGYFPLMAGILLCLLGTLVALFTNEVEKTSETTRIKAAIAVFAAILVWALLLDRFGMIPATVALVLIAAFAHPKPNPRRVIITAVALPLLGWGLFIQGLGLPVAAFSW